MKTALSTALLGCAVAACSGGSTDLGGRAEEQRAEAGLRDAGVAVERQDGTTDLSIIPAYVSLDRTRFSQLISGAGNAGSLQLLALGGHHASLADWQDTTGRWQRGGPLPDQTVKFAALTTGVGVSNGASALQIVGLGANDSLAYLATWQDSGGKWHSGGPLPNQTVKLSALTTGTGVTRGGSALQVVGLGAHDGLAYLAAWQDGGGNWHGGGPLANQTVKLSALTMGVGVTDGGSALQVVGLGANDGLAYLAAWQDGGGNWRDGGPLPNQAVKLSALTMGVGVSNGAAALQVVGLGANDGLAYLAAWQDGAGTWHNDHLDRLPHQTVKFSALTIAVGADGGSAALQVIGLGANDGLGYLAAWQDAGGNWQGGGPLPGQTVKVSSLVTGAGFSNGAPALQVFGLRASDSRPLLVGWQDSTGKWHDDHLGQLP